jgi:hypothetical protein
VTGRPPPVATPRTDESRQRGNDSSVTTADRLVFESTRTLAPSGDWLARVLVLLRR